MTELKHVGVLGMKWGRRSQPIGAKQPYRKMSERASNKYKEYQRKEHVEEWLGSHGKSTRGITKKKMKDVEAEMQVELEHSKRLVKVALAGIGTLALVTVVAKKLGYN